MESDYVKKRKKIGVIHFIAGVVVLVAAPTAFFVTCEAVTVGAVQVVHPDARGEAYHANYILYGMFLGIPLGLVAAGAIVWFVARRTESMVLNRREKIEEPQQNEEE